MLRDALFEVPASDRALAVASGYPLHQHADGTLILTGPRAIGDRYQWPRRWDLEIARRSSDHRKPQP